LGSCWPNSSVRPRFSPAEFSCACIETEPHTNLRLPSVLRVSRFPEFPRAILAGANRPQIIECEYSRRMPVGEINLDGVVADGLRRARAGLGFVHWQHARRSGRRCSSRRGRLGRLLVSLIITARAGTLFAQINKVVVARVSIAPGDVHTFPRGNVNLHAGGLFSGIDGRGHFIFKTENQSGSGLSHGSCSSGRRVFFSRGPEGFRLFVPRKSLRVAAPKHRDVAP
jgi:hypothetical protein